VPWRVVTFATVSRIGKVYAGGARSKGPDAITVLSEPKFTFLRDHVYSSKAIAATQDMWPNTHLAEEIHTEFIRGMIASADFFRVLGVRPARVRLYGR
jgi:hypothetical protein